MLVIKDKFLDIDQIISAVISAVVQAGGRCTFGIDVSEWSGDDIRALIAKTREEAKAKGVNLKGIRAGADVIYKLGGLAKGWENARFEDDLPVVSVPDFGMMDMVFRP